MIRKGRRMTGMDLEEIDIARIGKGRGWFDEVGGR